MSDQFYERPTPVRGPKLGRLADGSVYLFFTVRLGQSDVITQACDERAVDADPTCRISTVTGWSWPARPAPDHEQNVEAGSDPNRHGMVRRGL